VWSCVRVASRRVTVTPRHSPTVLIPNDIVQSSFAFNMGAAQSYVTSEAAVTVVLVAGAIGFGYTQVSHGSSSTSSTSHSPAGSNAAGKKGKKKKGSDASSPELAPTASLPRPAPPTAIPGGFDTPTVSTPTPAVVDMPPPKHKKSKKKKKGKAAPVSTASGPTAPDAASTAGYHSDSSAEHQQPKAKRPQKSSPSSSQLTRTPALPSTISIDTDGSWTRVGSSRRKQSTVSAGMVSTSDGPSGPSADPTSDAVTTSVTGNSSPVAERTEDEGLVYNAQGPEMRRPLAERLLPKPRKTGVDELRLFRAIHQFVHLCISFRVACSKRLITRRYRVSCASSLRRMRSLLLASPGRIMKTFILEKTPEREMKRTVKTMDGASSRAKKAVPVSV
jgi:hypothetical protein